MHNFFFCDTPKVLLVYVDDVFLTSNNISEIQLIKTHINNKFHIKELGPLRYFLGLEVLRSYDELILNQQKYCLNLTSETGLLGFKSTSTPSDPSIKLCANEGLLLIDLSSY